MSRASTSAVNLAYDFFDPSGLERTVSTRFASHQRLSVPYQSVDLDCLYIVQLLQSLLDLSLVCLDIHNEDQRIVLLDFFHRTFRIQWVNDDFMVVESGLMRNRFSRVFWCSGEDEGLRSVEGSGEADFAGFFGVHLVMK